MTEIHFSNLANRNDHPIRHTKKTGNLPRGNVQYSLWVSMHSHQPSLDGHRSKRMAIVRPIISAVKAEVTVGEVNSVLREEFGTWVAPSGV